MNKPEKVQCEVCGKYVDKLYYYASPFGPVSFGHCKECLDSYKEPYWAIVLYIAGAGHFPEDINEDYQEIVRRQLKLHNISEEQFIEDVRAQLELADIIFGDD
jgi:hypothetical protein